MNNNTKRSIILEHYQNPHHKGLKDQKDYLKVNMNNESCIDEINIELKIENNIIKDINFDGQACAMCISSSSIMTDLLIGKTKQEAKEILKNFFNMLDEKEYNKEVLEEACVYDETYKQPNRKKCVLLPWWAVEKILKQLER